ncbi:MAG: carboxypeptidase-like regulatory domain-containing protein [Myxococcaceae bacterium]|jgi:hypothetical protein|nr:carboxypeptidase-like regulatory domain-containing protein [Myxococcaceae bacterium]
MIRTLTAAAVAALVACAPPPTDTNKDGIADGVRAPDTVTAIAPATPTGTVTGVVMNTKFAPLADANVTLVLGTGFTAAIRSGGDGAFRFDKVPAGANGQVIVSRDGFGTVRTPVTVPASAGNVPLNDGNANAGLILLVELSGSVRYQVQTANGRPARGVRALLEVSPAGFVGTGGQGFGTPAGQLSFEGQADDNGTISFMNVPAPSELARVSTGTNYTLIVGGLDEDGDGDVEFNGIVDQRSGRDFFVGGVPTLRMSDNRTAGPPAIVATNIESLNDVLSPARNMLKPTDSVWVVFNQPINDKSLLVRATQEDCATVVPTSVVVRGNVLQINASGNGWTLGEKHNLLIRATGLEAAGATATASFTGFVFGGDPAMPRSPMAVTFSFRRAMGNMSQNVRDGDTLFITFDAPLKPGTSQAFFQYGFDLNQMNGTNPMDFGEFGNANGFAFSPDEATADPAGMNPFGCKVSTFTRRFRATASMLPLNGVPSSTQMRVVFPVAGSGQAGWQTLWGQPFTGQRDTMSISLIQN